MFSGIWLAHVLLPCLMACLTPLLLLPSKVSCITWVVPMQIGPRTRPTDAVFPDFVSSFKDLLSLGLVKQRTIALSSTEAEYYALTHAFKEALWLCVFLTLLALPVPCPFSIFSDNQAAISLSSSTSLSSRSKHIDIRYHFLRSHISDGSFIITWIPSVDMPADIFTKPLPDPVFSRHRSVLGLVPLPSLP